MGPSSPAGRVVVVEMLVQRRSVVEGLLRSAIVLGLFYVFLVAISMLGSVFKEMGHGQAETLVTQLSPLASLAVGILATVLVQSSSVTTSLVVGVVATSPSGSLLESIQPFVPMIMGANIGTTITNTLASLGHVTRTREFERAFAGATVHDFFNLLTVLILLPLELATGFLSRTAVWLVEVLQLSSSVEFHSPVKAVVRWGRRR
jgi:sodium-dependent phosphate cotransporter